MLLILFNGNTYVVAGSMSNLSYYGGRAPALPTAMVQTGAPARSEIVINQASRAKALYEMISGAIPAGTIPSAPRPPHSAQPGHDHSGGVFGAPIVRPHGVWSFGYEDATLGATVLNGRCPHAVLNSPSPTPSDQLVMVFQSALKHVWIPGCAPDGSHHSGRFRIVMWASAAVTCYFEFPGAGSGVFSKGLSAGRNVVDVTDNVQLNPGVISRIPLQIYMKGTGAGAAITVALRSITLNQIATDP